METLKRSAIARGYGVKGENEYFKGREPILCDTIMVDTCPPVNIHCHLYIHVLSQNVQHQKKSKP